MNAAKNSLAKFRIQYTNGLRLELYNAVPKFETVLKPVAPYLALADNIGHPLRIRELFAWAAPQWKRIFYIQRILEAPIPKEYENIHFLHPGSSYFCEEENVAVVGTFDSVEDLDQQIDIWKYRGAEVCVLSYQRPSGSLLRPPIRLWIYGDSATCSHNLQNSVLCVSNPLGVKNGWRPDVWMEFSSRDPQELETFVKKDQTPLRWLDSYTV